MKTIRRASMWRGSIVASMFGGAAVMVAGCGTSPAPTSVVCTDFRAGADLSQSTFGVTGDLQRSYGAFAQAAGDLAAVANGMLRDVGAACEGLALELGADRNDPRVVGKRETEAVRGWCKIAAERFDMVRPQLTRVHFAVQIATPKCTVDTSFQVTCESKCRADAACVEASPEERCPEEGRAGICGGTCSGTCTGSETAPATCEGTCGGMCFGTCGGSASADPDANANADGAGAGNDADADAGAPASAQGVAGSSAVDEGRDCSTGCVCTGVCHGTCTAGCEVAMPGAACDATCSGGCSEPMRGQSCAMPLAAPTCAGDVDCQKSCSASSSARAVCPEGSLSIIVDDAARSDAEIAQIVGAMERNLPAIFLAARGRAKVLADGASDLLDSAGRILSRSSDIGPMGAACGMLIGQTGSEAKNNLKAALAGSRDVAHAVTGEVVEKEESDDE